MQEEINERRTIFISHALPEDIEVALWVAAKLRNEGYEVWCEVEQVHGGEHFWKTIEPLIRDKTAKFVFLASQASVKKQGVRMEWDFALGVARDYALQDFIIPVNLDGVSPNSLMGLPGLAMIQFQASWAHGIKALLTKLRKDDVPKNTASTPLSAAHWYFHRFTSHNDALKKTENFYSNWVALPLPPRDLYFHRYSNEAQARAVLDVLQESKLFPVVRHDTYIVTFEPAMPLLELPKSSTILFEATAVIPLERRAADTHLILTRRYDSKTFPQRQDASNLLVHFLQQAVHEYFLSRGLRTYQMSSNKTCYYYPRKEDTDLKVKYNYEGKMRNKQLSGAYYDAFWHFAVSFNPRFRPEAAVSFKSHIVFSDDGQTVWDDKKKLVSARRKKGKLMFNAEWRDSLLAFLSSLSDDQTTFHIPVTATQQLAFSTTPIVFTSPKGYNDPIDKGRLAPLDDFDNEEEYTNDPEFDANAALAELIVDEDPTGPTPLPIA
jgi:hypothetical protein